MDGNPKLHRKPRRSAFPNCRRPAGAKDRVLFPGLRRVLCRARFGGDILSHPRAEGRTAHLDLWQRAVRRYHRTQGKRSVTGILHFALLKKSRCFCEAFTVDHLLNVNCNSVHNSLNKFFSLQRRGQGWFLVRLVRPHFCPDVFRKHRKCE
jgi:hypothetical protein